MSNDASFGAPQKPSSLYRAELWRIGLVLAGRLPGRLSKNLARWLAWLYWRVNSERREIVQRNIRPVVQHENVDLHELTRELFREFGEKVADLLAYESGSPINHLMAETIGWEHLEAAYARNKGVLLLTPHIGNWEFGSGLLIQKGFRLLVITQTEPQENLTRLRISSRSHWGVETLVLGEDLFAFVEVIRRLESGAVIALLMDRPSERSAVTVKLFGQPFRASIAAAELARATGCALVPVVLPRVGGQYRAQLLPEVLYDREALSHKESRRQLTQEIMYRFEPVIRDHVTQWFHFVSVWPSHLPEAPEG